MDVASISSKTSIFHALVASVIAGCVGIVAGAVMARLDPSDKLSWAGLAMAPLWFLLESCFESVSEVASSVSKIARILSSIAAIAGFYIAWYAMH
jgi:hypothetical protein